ncbi:hypothetical protein OWV82_022025 [Melia azedarach]|uniref:Uncharacterized protein n=1 Tax=Melia azedarach TaxID=155640 RepID=A0ACC1X3K9_MELAZ|nr:hypothetical protein OWV82_022025 [Melia azedarach]
MFRARPKETDVKHFVDLRRYLLTKKHPVSYTDLSTDLPCALKLQESGVKFTCIRGQGLLDIKFPKERLRIPCLKVNKELPIPNFKVMDGTECLIRNVMALEQCHYPSETLVCNYIILMDHLINTEEDVELLVEAGIISNHIGENARIAKMFNELCLQININSSCYSDIVNDLNEHYGNRCNHSMATLKKVYFSNCWRGTATSAAIVILFLTFIGTVCSILQVV